MEHLTQLLSRFLADLRYEDLPKEAVETTKLYILDYYAACCAGIRVNETFNHAVEDILFEMGGKEEASVFASSRKLPAVNAAFLNAAYAHGADMDDGNRKAMGHVAAHVMSAVFALAETLEVSGKDIIVAINAGYEVYNRIAAAVQPGLVRRGFHSTGTAGAVACGAAAAKLLGLGEQQIYAAISLSAVQASGLMIITESGQSCKSVNPANAARTGILSAKLAAKGIQAPKYPLESNKGWLHAMSDHVDERAITDGLGKTFTICESYLKPYPSCRHTHCGIEGALRIRQQILETYGRVCQRDIAYIAVDIYPNAIAIAGQIRLPKTDEDSKFSIHYSLACALMKGHFGLEDLPVSAVDADIEAVTEKICLVEDGTMENRAEGIRGCRVTIRMEDGTIYTETVLIPKGDAANPFTKQEMQAKLQSCAAGLLTQAQQEQLTAFTEGFDGIEHFSSVNAFLEK